MGRPINPNYLYNAILSVTNPSYYHPIKATVWAPGDAGATALNAGYLLTQNSGHRFKAKGTANSGICTLTNGTPAAAGQAQVQAKVWTWNGTTWIAGATVNVSYLGSRWLTAYNTTGIRYRWFHTTNLSTVPTTIPTSYPTEGQTTIAALLAAN